MEILNYVSESSVFFVEKEKKSEVLSFLVQKSYELGFVKNSDEFRKAIEEREAVISTGVGLGAAFPHAKLDSIKDFFVIIGVLKEPVEWDSFDQKPVNVVFLIGGPDNRQKDYLKILSFLMITIKDKEKREIIINAKNPTDVIKVFSME